MRHEKSRTEKQAEGVVTSILQLFQLDVKNCASRFHSMLKLRQQRATERIVGLGYFTTLLRAVETPSVRRQLVRCFASSFQRKSSQGPRMIKVPNVVALCLCCSCSALLNTNIIDGCCFAGISQSLSSFFCFSFRISRTSYSSYNKADTKQDATIINFSLFRIQVVK